jgi:curli biogenesis system outer membrane secretion channel CsgG
MKHFFGLLGLIVGVMAGGCATSDAPSAYFRDAGQDSNVYVAPGHSAIRKVAVMPFKAETELIGSAVSDQVVTELLRTGRYELIERSQMARVLGEQELALAGLSAGRAAEVGAMLGADGVVIGTVAEYGKIAAGGKTYPSVAIACRLIDTRTGKVIWSADVAGRAASSATPLAQHSREMIHEMIAGVFKEMSRVR